MDFVFWIIVIVLIVGVVWWLRNRSSSSKGDGSAAPRTDGGLAGGSAAASAEAAATAGIPGSAGFGSAGPLPPTTADEAPERSGPAAEPASGEWETQWSETSGSAQPAYSPAADAHASAGPTDLPEATPASGPEYVHHAEYTEPHSPTLPGAETAAAEAADDSVQASPPKAPVAEAPVQPVIPESAAETETRESARSSAAVETAANHSVEPPAAAADHEPLAEPAGHLAADQPYGAGSAPPAADGSGPGDFAVKADAGAMVYYEEGHPDYEQARAEVWFESAAHAEAAGFRAPRRKRL